jgi:hypothetical protein
VIITECQRIDNGGFGENAPLPAAQHAVLR